VIGTQFGGACRLEAAISWQRMVVRQDEQEIRQIFRIGVPSVPPVPLPYVALISLHISWNTPVFHSPQAVLSQNTGTVGRNTPVPYFLPLSQRFAKMERGEH
jgi:hypothetical protein